MNVKEKATAPVSSVGADGKQPLCKTNKESIADLPDKGNLQATNNRGCGTEVSTEKRDRIDELETVSMTELYDTVYDGDDGAFLPFRHDNVHKYSELQVL